MDRHFFLLLLFVSAFRVSEQKSFEVRSDGESAWQTTSSSSPPSTFFFLFQWFFFSLSKFQFHRNFVCSFSSCWSIPIQFPGKLSSIGFVAIHFATLVAEICDRIFIYFPLWSHLVSWSIKHWLFFFLFRFGSTF